MRIYLDLCCLNRPFDDQQQPRIRLEAEAVLLVLHYCETKVFEWVGSDVVKFEIDQTGDPERKRRLEFLASYIIHGVLINEQIEKRAEKFETWGISGMDAYHLAAAEYAKADVFLTTDDDLLKRANYHKKDLFVRAANPLSWIREMENQ